MKKLIIKCLNYIKKPLLITMSLLLLCGFVYPITMTVIGQVFFTYQANGSLIMVDDKAVGSQLIGQDFSENYFMKCRPSAGDYNTYTKQQKEDNEYTGPKSFSDNLGPTNPELIKRVQADIEIFLKANPTVELKDIPTDLMTASGSGLDPHISPIGASIQLDALVIHTGLTLEVLENIVKNNTVNKGFNIFGADYVNVLGVNLEIAKLMGKI